MRGRGRGREKGKEALRRGGWGLHIISTFITDYCVQITHDDHLRCIRSCAGRQDARRLPVVPMRKLLADMGVPPVID